MKNKNIDKLIRLLEDFRKEADIKQLQKGNYIGYREYGLKCDTNGNRLCIKAPYNQFATLVCVKHKTYCHSGVCLKERYHEKN